MSEKLEVLISTREGRVLLSLALQTRPELLDRINSVLNATSGLGAIPPAQPSEDRKRDRPRRPQRFKS